MASTNARAGIELEQCPGYDAFEWDEAKRRATIEKHGIDFRRVALILAQPHWRYLSRREGELRYVGISEIAGKTVSLVYVERDGVCRIVTAFRSKRPEERAYRAFLDRGDPGEAGGR